MTKALIKNTFREIKNSKARFISIMAIIALGVGFFAGIKATAPSMYNLAETYYSEHNLMDYRLLSTTGFSLDDVEAVRDTRGVEEVMPSYFCDLITSADDGGSIVRLIAIPKAYKNHEQLNTLALKRGRMPEKENEILVEDQILTGAERGVGSKISFAEMAGDTDVSENLSTLEYTIVGTVESPLYISYQRGSTTVGDGKIAEFMYVPQESFTIERYTELYVKAEFSEDCSPFSDEYKAGMEEMLKTLEQTAEQREEAFEVEVIGKAKDELNDAKSEFASEKSKADDEFAKAEKELGDAKDEFDEKISEAEKELTDAKNQINSGKSEYTEAESEYYSQISSAEQLLADKEGELEQAELDYEAGKKEFDEKIASAQAQIDAGYIEYNSAYENFTKYQEPILLFAIESAQKVVDGFKEQIEVETDEQKLDLYKTQLARAEDALVKAQGYYDEALAKITDAKSQLDNVQAELDKQKTQGETELSSALSQIENGKAELKKAKQELEDKKFDGYKQLADAKAQLDSAQSQYESGKSEFDTQKSDGQKKLDTAQKEYSDKKSEAEQKFEDAQAEIDEAEEKVSSIESSQWYVFTREDNPGYSTFSQNADRLDAVASVFPLFFLLVAILVCVTTMTRLVEEKRNEIATFTALGYSNSSIVMKFVIYSLIAGIIGSVIGIVIGVTTLPFIIYNAYKIMYYIGDITLVLHIPSIILGVLAAILCTTLVSIIVCMCSLKQKPAQAMRPKAPKAGKRILLEYITPLWHHMSFTLKLTSRNLFRYKSRLLMTVIGVAGCTALIVAAFGLLNSFDPLKYDQYGEIFKYDAVVVPKESSTAEGLKYLIDKLDSNDLVNSYMLSLNEEAEVSFKDNTKNESTYLTVPQSLDGLDDIVSFHTRTDKKELTLTTDGVFVNEKLCTEFGIGVGDTIKISSASGDIEVKVSGIYENYVHNYIFMSPQLYSELYGTELSFNMIDTVLKDCTEEEKNKFSEDLLADERIVAVSFIEESVKEFTDMLDSLNLVVAVMIICAAALAFVVLYNLTNINISERVREIATFKVLGFHNKETSSFIYKENIALTLMGIGAGLVLGMILSGFIIKTVEVDNIMFGREIYFTSYLYASLLTMLFSVIVNAVMSIKIKAVNMVESLKSIE